MSVLFVSQLPLGRCENMTAVYEAYGGEKEFRHGTEAMRDAEREGFSVVVCDCLPVFIRGKNHCVSVNIGHGIAGGKLYGADEGGKPWFDPAAAAQTDYAVAASRAGVGIVARQLGIPERRVLPLGMPRTDAYFRERPAQDGRTYLYAPTFRDGDGRLPDIDWALLDSLLADGEKIAVKRHYFTREPLVGGEYEHVSEIGPDCPTAGLLAGCSALLTDYSSILIDAYLLGTPAVLATDDMDDYLSRRGMYWDYPYAYCSRHMRVEGNEEALASALREAAASGMGGAERRFLEISAGACDGRSTERVCGLIGGLE